MYGKHTTVNKVYLMRRLFDLEINEGVYVAKHFNDFNSIIRNMSLLKIDFDDVGKDFDFVLSIKWIMTYCVGYC